ncbi:START domain-containing protein [Flagellimonas aquimarina]|uniref:START domain-containing protein n=1 Tax=Flagellimonas aquimarina TaxID=2201895 RepID=UPI0014029D8A|nr:START domain-containing protein [Allomuricauda koreensis]
MLILVPLAGCSTHRAIRLRNKSLKEWGAYQWSKDKEHSAVNKTWTIYSRKVKGSKFKEFKITGKVMASPKKAVMAFQEEIVNNKSYPYKNEGSFKILSSSKDSLIVYSVHPMPFPFRDRSICKRVQISSDSESGIKKIQWTEDWVSNTEDTKGTVHMNRANGFWMFEPGGKSQSIATYVVHAEPGGNIPAWLFNSTIEKGLVKKLKRMEMIIQKMEQAALCNNDW